MREATRRFRPSGPGPRHRASRIIPTVAIAVVVRTLTSIVFAADSKLTTHSRAGRHGQSETIIVPQTHGHATTIVADASGTGMAAVVGGVTLGRMSFMDYIARTPLPTLADHEQQTTALQDVAEALAAFRTEYWRGVPEDRWPVTQVLVATSCPATPSPQLWEITFQGMEPRVGELNHRLYFAGSYRQVLSLPLDQIDPQVMPIQDAMDLAYFLATTEIEMERFLPGEAACGGPVDVMVLRCSPTPEILWHPGKSLRHPADR